MTSEFDSFKTIKTRSSRTVLVDVLKKKLK